jgi:patatin-like phospholipase/acyl hydrolase
MLREVFADVKLSALLRPCLVPAYDIQRRKAHFFKQHRAREPGRDFLVRDLARGTSAAPTYFECARISSDSGSVHALVDGGVVANNPAMCGYAEAREAFGRSAQDMVVLSVGSGAHKKAYSYYNARDWGLVEWARPALDIFMTGVSETVDYQLAQIFEAAGRRDFYLRLQAELASEQAELDNTKSENLKALRRAGEATAQTHEAELTAIARLLVTS